FNGYFLDGDDISDVGTLVQIGVRANISEDDLRAYLESDGDLEAVKSEDMQARQLGIQGVPFYILDGQYAISGAQEPEAFHPLFDMLVAQRHGEENEGLNFG
ncbi:MAG: DsbA family protein, partial [Alphaproteobacteria bacterium]|nr:DsbA family protein [Alphaproteobacteria bacterium]